MTVRTANNDSSKNTTRLASHLRVRQKYPLPRGRASPRAKPTCLVHTADVTAKLLRTSSVRVIKNLVGEVGVEGRGWQGAGGAVGAGHRADPGARGACWPGKRGVGAGAG